MEITTTAIIIIGLTGFISSLLSLGAKLMYDGIKAKHNGNGNSKNANQQISVNLALLVKDIDFNNKKLAEIENSFSRLIEYAITSNIHLEDIKTAIVKQNNTFQTIIAEFTTAITRLEDKL